MQPVLQWRWWLVAATFSAHAASAQPYNVIDTLLSPFAGIDLGQTYDAYTSLIDFAIYTMLFTGIAQATLGQRFTSRGGKAVVTAVGLVLAIGLVISETMLGFNLRSFGPLAAGLFIFLVGFCLYLGIKTAGMDAASASSITFVVVYFSIRAVAPGFFDWMTGNRHIAWLHSILLIAVLFSLYKVVRLILPGNKSDLAIGEKIRTGPKEFFEHMQAEKQEKDFIGAHLEKITHNAEKTSKKVLEDLQEVRKLIEVFGHSAKGRFLLAKKIQTLTPKEYELARMLKALQERVEKLATFDHTHFEKLKKIWHDLSSDMRKEVEEEIRAEWKKIRAENQLAHLHQAATQYDHHFQHAIRMIIASLKAHRSAEALSWTDEAIKWERHSLQTLVKVGKIEKRLQSYIDHEIKAMDRQAHKAAKSGATKQH